MREDHTKANVKKNALSIENVRVQTGNAVFL